MAKAHKDYQGLFCYIGITVFTAMMILSAVRLSHVDRFCISDAGIFIVCIAAIFLILSVRITERWNTRGEIIAATALGIIPAVIYPLSVSGLYSVASMHLMTSLSPSPRLSVLAGL